MRTTSPRLFVATLALSIVAISCGGGDDAMGGNSSTRLNDEAFCAKIVSLDNQTSGDDTSPEAMLEMLQVIQDMAKVAPTAELQEAFEAYAPLLEGMAKLDQNDAQNDPEAFSTMMGQLFTPEVMKAVEILEAYSTDVCGIEDGSDSSSPPTS
jgi:hypothetical protein